MTSESCTTMYFAGKKPFANAFRFSFDVEATSFYTDRVQFLSISARGTAARVVRTHVCSVWELNEYLQYSWIIFPHCSSDRTKPQVAQALDANIVRNFFLGCWVTIGT